LTDFGLRKTYWKPSVAGISLLNRNHPLKSLEDEECVRIVHPQEVPDNKGMLIPKDLRKNTLQAFGTI
jgi:hypothetical protein